MVMDTLPIAAAQRYSVLVTAKNTTDFNYLMHLNLSPDMPDIADVPPASKFSFSGFIYCQSISIFNDLFLNSNLSESSYKIYLHIKLLFSQLKLCFCFMITVSCHNCV